MYRLLGLTVGLVCGGLDDAARREAYACSITYATNAELGFDYLRDNLALSPDQVIKKGESKYVFENAEKSVATGPIFTASL